MTRLALVLACAAAASGCVHRVVYEPRMACQLAQANLREVRRNTLSTRELAEAVSSSQPAFEHAMSAYRQATVATVFGAVGAAALAGGLVMGFAVSDPAETGVRAASYSLVGGAIGLFGVGIILGLTQMRARARAVEAFSNYAAGCHEPLP